jgi:hypothetical protein
MEDRPAMLKTIVAPLEGILLFAAVALAQGPVTNRMPTATMRGVIVEVTCFRQQGAATITTPEQTACARKRVAEGGRLGILTEGDGLFQITGSFADNKFSKVTPFIGKNVDLTGAEVTISNNYDYKSFEAAKIVLAKKN